MRDNRERERERERERSKFLFDMQMSTGGWIKKGKKRRKYMYR